jgi:hypothetical protein
MPENSETIDKYPIQEHEKTRYGRAIAWLAGAATSIFLGVQYIASHGAEPENIMMSTDLAHKTIGFDTSELIVGGLALTAATICISAASNILFPQKDS